MLHKTVYEIKQMSTLEYKQWILYFKMKKEAEEKEEAQRNADDLIKGLKGG